MEQEFFLTFTPLYYSLIIQTFSELMSYADWWSSAGSVQIMEHVFIPEELAALEGQISHIKCPMASALIALQTK